MKTNCYFRRYLCGYPYETTQITKIADSCSFFKMNANPVCTARRAPIHKAKVRIYSNRSVDEYYSYCMNQMITNYCSNCLSLLSDLLSKSANHFP
jgi:hypothetical protein